MADEIRKVVTVDVSGAVDSLEEMRREVETSGYSFKSLGDAKKYIDMLRASLIDLEDDSDEYEDRVKEIDTVQQKLNKAMKVTGTTLKSAEGSYNALSKKMSDLKKAFKQTNDEAERKVLAKEIASINNQLKEMDASIGNYQRNVGNYQQAFTAGITGIAEKIEALGNPLAIAKNGVIALSNAFKSLIANPVGAAIMVIVGALAALKKGFEADEVANNSLKKAMAAFEPIINMVTNAFAGFARVVGKIAENVIPALVNGVYKAGSAMMTLLNKVGLVSDEKLAAFRKSIDLQKEAVKTSVELADREIKLEETRRKNQVETAKKELEISELRAKAADKDKYTAAERQKFLEQAVQNEREINQAKLDLAQEEYDIAKKRSEMSVNNKADNDALAAAEAKLYETRKEFADKERGLIKEISKTKKEQAAVNKAYLADEAKTAAEAAKLLEEQAKKVEAIKERLNLFGLTGGEKDLIKLKKQYDEELALMQQFNEDTTKLTEEYQQNVAGAISGETEKRELKSLKDGYELKKLIIENTIKDEERKNIELAKLDEDYLYEQKKLYDGLLNTENLSPEKQEEYAGIIEMLTQRMIAAKQKKDEADEAFHQREKSRIEEEIEMYSELADAIGSILGSVADMWQNSIERKIEAGEISQEEGEKEFDRVKALQIAVATISTLTGAVSAFMKAQETYPQPYGLIVGAASAAAVTAAGIAEIAKIKSTTIGGGGSLSESSSTGAAAPTPEATSYTPSYSTNITGQSETVDLANAVTSGQQSQRVYVVESDIQEAGKRVQVVEAESTF